MKLFSAEKVPLAHFDLSNHVPKLAGEPPSFSFQFALVRLLWFPVGVMTGKYLRYLV